jgi:hypothetical protein
VIIFKDQWWDEEKVPIGGMMGLIDCYTTGTVLYRWSIMSVVIVIKLVYCLRSVIMFRELFIMCID